jgi:cell division protein FtsA
MTGMDTRIGYPNEHLAPDVPEELASPMYATGIGLVIEGIGRYNKELTKDIGSDRKKEQSDKKIRERSKPKSSGFLKRIQDWFEGDAEE